MYRHTVCQALRPGRRQNADSKTGDAFVVDAGDGDRAMDVFDHPYAYAAWRGVDVRAAAVAVPVTGLAAA